MKTELWKRLGVILSALWILIVGYFVVMFSFFAENAPRSAWLQILSDFGFFYVVFGLGPVLGFILLMNRLDDPLSKTALTVLASLAAIPIILVMVVVF